VYLCENLRESLWNKKNKTVAAKYFTFFILLMPLHAAKGQGKYYPKLQWYTSSNPNFPVKYQPEKVTEYFYGGVDSLMKTDLKKFGSYDEFTYDTAGNLLSRKLFFNDNFWSLYTSTFNPTGERAEYQFKSNNGIDKGVFLTTEPTNDGRFRQIIYSDHKESKVTFYSYKNNGNDVVSEEHKNMGAYTTTTITNLQYNGRQLLSRFTKIVDGKDTAVVRKFYFYSLDNSLDSIITFSGKERKRQLFVKNEHGDPLAEIEIEHNDTTEYKTYTYLYDAKGNWIRRVEEDRLSFGQIVFQNQKFSMVRREIIY
jgi:hypothetical protein